MTAAELSTPHHTQQGGGLQTVDTLVNASWAGLRTYLLQPRVNVANITVPALLVGSAEDAYFGGQDAVFLQQLQGANNTRSQSVVFSPESGAAAANQIGAAALYEQVVYPWLQGLRGIGT